MLSTFVMMCIAASQPVTAEIVGDQVVVTVNGVEFTRYKAHGDPGYESQKYPYFYPVNGPVSGKSVTTETTQPYPHHHSLFFGCDRVNGGNYWQGRNDAGQIISQGPRIIEAKGSRVVFEDTCLWRKPGEAPIIRDTRTVTITAPSSKRRIIDFDISLEMLTNVTFLNTNHALFSARVVPALSVKEGGTLVNAAGQSGEKATFGQKSPWMDYSGTRDGVAEGIAIFQHPDNPGYPFRWFTRDYGFFSPTPMQWLDGGQLDLPKGERVRLRYRVLVHAGDAREADMVKAFDAYAGKGL